jgi:LDH2 family malate/lactate/ureidoglycolate dehydrogenase
MDRWISRFRSAKPAAGEDQVLIPGDPERLMESSRRISGIPLLEPVIKGLNELAVKFEISPPEAKR